MIINFLNNHDFKKMKNIKEQNAINQHIIAQAKVFLDEADEFYPFATAISTEGLFIPIGANLENDNPSSELLIEMLDIKIYFMKSLFYISLLFLCFSSYSQKRFIRIYDTTGHKIASGRIVGVNDSTVQLSDKLFPISYRIIGVIRTKHSAGYYLGNGIIIGLGTGILVPAILFKQGSLVIPDRGSAALVGGIIGLPIGGIVGAIFSAFTKRDVFIINGTKSGWEFFYKNFVPEKDAQN